MKQKLIIIFLSVLLCSWFGLTSCKDTEKEEAVAEAAAAKAELTKITAALASIMSERDNLKLELATVIEARDTMVDQAKNIKEQLAGLTEERDAAIAKVTEINSVVEILRSELAKQFQTVAGLESKNKKLQGMIDELKRNLGSEVEIPPLPDL
jgi:uncharacterized coiled-coil DUF342 family protein